MEHDHSPGTVTAAQRERRERWVAWATNTLACLYCAWMGLYLWRSTGGLGVMFEGLGAQLPVATRILVTYRNWIYPWCFGGLVAILVAKELLMRDKRLTTMLTFLVTIAAQFLAQWMITVCYLPLFDLIDKLS